MFDPNYAHRNFPRVRTDWLGLVHEEVLEPERTIIDPHHHLWDVDGSRYLAPEFTDDLRSGHNVVATVFVECKFNYRETGPEALKPVGETEFVASVRSDGAPVGVMPCAAIVGFADLAAGASVSGVLQAHQQAGGGRFRGIRVRAAWHADPAFPSPADGPPPGLLAHPVFREGFAQLAPLGLSCDLWVFHTQLAEAAALAAAFPETPIVLNHVGGPLGIGPYAGKRDEVFAAWRKDLKVLSAHDNVCVKVGGLAMPRIGFAFDTLDQPPTSAMLAEAWAPYIDTCLALFGPGRCMFESNFPVDKGMTGWVVIWNAFKRMAAGLSEAEKHAVFYGTAADFYRIGSGR